MLKQDLTLHVLNYTEHSLPKEKNKKSNWTNEGWIKRKNHEIVCWVKRKKMKLTEQWTVCHKKILDLKIIKAV